MWPEREVRDNRRGGYPARPVGAADDLALAIWVCTCLVGVIVGLGLAKYAQAWSGLAAHPGAIAGAVVVLLGIGLALAAAGRYQARGGSRAIGLLAALLVALPGWLALAIIAVASWAWPPARPGG